MDDVITGLIHQFDVTDIGQFSGCSIDSIVLNQLPEKITSITR